MSAEPPPPLGQPTDALGAIIDRDSLVELSGALKVYDFKDGALGNLASIARGNGLGFGPRHFDFHPTQPWVFLSVERQSELHVYPLNGDGTLPAESVFIKNALADRANHMPTQMSGAIHVHPNGRFVYMTNRNSGTEEIAGRKVFKRGENNIAVFSIDPSNGEPTLPLLMIVSQA